MKDMYGCECKMNRKKLLFLTQRIPYPPIKGEKIRPLQILKWLSERYEVYLGSLIDDPDDWAHVEVISSYCADAFFADLPSYLRRARLLLALVKGQPLSFAVFQDRKLQRWVETVLRSVDPEICFVCSSNMAPYVVDKLSPRTRLLVDFADVDSEKWRIYAERARLPKSWIFSREARLTLAAERYASKRARVCTFVTDVEAQLFRARVPEAAEKTRAVLNGVDIEYFDPDIDFDPPYDTERPNFVFTGTMDYWPNVDGAKWFAENIIPTIRATLPGAIFHIVGSRPNDTVKSLARHKEVNVTGRVPDVRPFLAYASAVVVPIRMARGIQNKVLEGMAMGKPVIVTPEALEGTGAVPGSELFLAETAESFAKLAILLAERRFPRQEEISRAGRERMVRDFNWPARLSQFEPLLEPGL